MRKVAISSIVAIAIILSVIVPVGIYFFSYSQSISNVIRQQEKENVNEKLLLLRSLISADYVFFPGEKALIRNIGEEPVVIFRLIVYNNGTPIWDSGISKIAEIPVKETGLISFECPGCRAGDSILLTVYYIPSELFDEKNPELVKPLSEVQIYKVRSFPVEVPKQGVISGVCGAPTQWSLVNFMDPVETYDFSVNDFVLTEYVKIQPFDSNTMDTIDIKLRTTSPTGSKESGVVSIPTRSDTELWIESNSQGARHPIDVEIIPVTPGWTVLPLKWEFGEDYGALIDYVKLTWTKISLRLVEAIVNVIFTDTGSYNIRVEIFDCRGNKIATGSRNVVVEVPIGAILQSFSIRLDRQVPILDTYYVKVSITNVSPHTTTTTTVTVTEYETVYAETTTTKTITEEVRTTTTTTKTKTKTETISTTTTTTIPTKTETVIERATTTTTRTLSGYSYTLVYTTITITSTITEQTPTTTITVTNTKTKTSYTTTITATTTETVTETVTTTTTVTVTTTVFDNASNVKLGSGVSDSLYFASLLGFLNLLVMIGVVVLRGGYRDA